MAARLQAHLASGQVPGFSPTLLVYNRTDSVAEAFAAATPGCRVAPSLVHLAAAAPAVVLCVLSDDAATDAVLAQFLEALPPPPPSGPSHQPPPVFVNCATLLPKTVTRHAAEAAAAGVLFANCPVFGRPDAAAAGMLIAMPAGPPAARERLAPLLPAFAGRGVWDLGDGEWIAMGAESSRWRT